MAKELWLIYVLIFGAGLLGAQALYWLLIRSRTERKIINRRLVLERDLQDQSAVLDMLRRERGIKMFGDVAALRWLDELITQSGIKVDFRRLLIWFLGLSVTFYLLLAIVMRLGLWSVVFAFPLALLAGVVILKRARARRIAKFSEQLPEALDIIVRGLRAGHPFRVALGLAARELPDPIGTELGIVLDEVTFGVEQEVAINHLYERVGQEDLSFVSTAINIQSQTGGNLADILHGLSRLLRNRIKLRLKVRALTSEGRASGMLLSALPFILLAMLNFLSPEYFSGLKGHPLLTPAVVVGCLLLIAGNVAMYRMVNFKV